MKKIFTYFIGIVSVIILTISLAFYSNIINSSFGLEENNNIEKIISKLSIDQKIGMNGHIDVPQDILEAGSVVREYHNFGWSITDNKQMFFQRFSWWDFDNYYKTLSDKGITILPCIQMGEQAVFNRNRNEKPVIKGDDTTDPYSYKIHSNYLFNYAARYGSTVVDESRLNLDPNDTVKTGLGYIKYYEDWNEPDKTWQGPDAQFNSTELAAMLSADYDGHEGKLGNNYGIKQADPNSKLVMGGMAGGSTMVTWLNEMKAWALINRTDKKLPLDVINYHQYAGIHSPENSTFVEDAKKIINWRDTNAQDKEIWITEFGWDTNLGSTKHAAPSEDAQRDWIIREYLIGDRIGLDRMTVYDALNDGPANDTTQYSTSGLATKVSEGTVKKSSWYGVNTLKYTMKGYKLSEVIKEDNQIYIYKYSNGDSICYVLWSPTENNTIINDYVLNVGNYKNATLTKLKNKEELGVTSSLDINQNSVIVDVSESPIFIKISGLIEDKKEVENPVSNSNNDNIKPIINENDKEITKEEENITQTEVIKEKENNVIQYVENKKDNNNSKIQEIVVVKQIIVETPNIGNISEEVVNTNSTNRNNNTTNNTQINNEVSNNNVTNANDDDTKTIETIKPKDKLIDNSNIKISEVSNNEEIKKVNDNKNLFIIGIIIITILLIAIIILFKKYKI